MQVDQFEHTASLQTWYSLDENNLRIKINSTGRKIYSVCFQSHLGFKNFWVGASFCFNKQPSSPQNSLQFMQRNLKLFVGIPPSSPKREALRFDQQIFTHYPVPAVTWLFLVSKFLENCFYHCLQFEIILIHLIFKIFFLQAQWKPRVEKKISDGWSKNEL